MDKIRILKLRDNTSQINTAVQWFHTKWNVPLKAYKDSMTQCVQGQNFVPQWYVVVDEDKIIAGAGVIENDFHSRKDLAPNICAVYVEESYRNNGIAGKLLDCICDDFNKNGIDTLYLLTNHDNFYERYGWQFLCMVQGDGEDYLSRMYIHKM